VVRLPRAQTTVVNTRGASKFVNMVVSRTANSAGMRADGVNQYNTGRTGLSREFSACGLPW
jgi:hypothetical protein